MRRVLNALAVITFISSSNLWAQPDDPAPLPPSIEVDGQTYVRDDSDGKPVKEDINKAPRYAGVPCIFHSPADELQCGLFPLKQAIGLAWQSYVERQKIRELTQTANDVGLLAINTFSFKTTEARVLDTKIESIPGAFEYYDLSNSQWREATRRLEPLITKLTEVRPSVEKLGPRAFELLLKHVRDSAVQALVDGFDPHSHFFASGSKELDGFKKFYATLQNNGEKFVGIGVAIRDFGPTVYVVMSYPGTPASEKLEQFDEILAVDGKMVHSRLETVKALRSGVVKSSVSLTIRRKGIKQNVTLERKELSGSTVAAKLYTVGDARVCYLFIGSFAENTHKEVGEVISPKGECASADRLILDLRINEGGNTNAAQKVLEMLLPSLKLYPEPVPVFEVHTNRTDFPVWRTSEDTRPHEWKYPIIILQSGETASSSEMLIGGLRPFSILIGDRTYGKLSAWGTYMLGDGSILTLTEVVYTFNRLNAEGKGFTPDIYFSRTFYTKKEVPDTIEREENLLRSLGQQKTFTAGEELQKIVSGIDPELAIAFGVLRSKPVLSVTTGNPGVILR